MSNATKYECELNSFLAREAAASLTTGHCNHAVGTAMVGYGSARAILRADDDGRNVCGFGFQAFAFCPDCGASVFNEAAEVHKRILAKVFGARPLPEYPEHTPGSQTARETREQVNGLGQEQRGELFRQGMQMIYSDPPADTDPSNDQPHP